MSEPSPEGGGTSTSPPITIPPESNIERPVTPNPSPALEDYQCPVCLDTFIDVVEAETCKHKFCSYCLQQWFRTRRNKFCPVCRSNIVNVTRLEDFTTTMEAHLSQLLTPEQLNERNQTRQNREETLRLPTSSADEEDESDAAVIRRMQEEFFPTMDGIVDDADAIWHFELDVEDAILTQGLFPQASTSAHGMNGHFTHTMRTREHNSFGSSRQPSRSRIRTRHFHYTPRYPPPSFRPYPVYEFLSEDSDYDRPTPTQEMPRPYRTYPSEVNMNPHLSNSEGNQRSTSASPSFEDLHSLRETIRLAEASMAAAPTEQNMSESRNSYPPHFRGRTHGFTSNSEERPMPLSSEQASLLAEFHHRFAQTELAFEAVTNAQNRLDVQGSSLRNIYDQCVRAGLLDHDNQRNFPNDERNNGYTTAFPPYLRQTFNREFPNFESFGNTSSPHYHSIWTTYLTGPNNSYQPRSNTNHGFLHTHGHQVQGHTWYQRCLNHQPNFQTHPLPMAHRSNLSYSEYYHNQPSYPDHRSMPYQQDNGHNHYGHNGRGRYEQEYQNLNTDSRDNRCGGETPHENHRSSTHEFRFHNGDSQVENAHRTPESLTVQSGDSDGEPPPDESILEEFRQFELSRSTSHHRQLSGEAVGAVDQGGDRNNHVGLGFQRGLHYN